MRSTSRPGQWGGRRGQKSIIALLGPILLSSCAAAPFLIPVAFEFARNLLQTGLQNYGSRHRDNLSNLVNRLSSPYMQGLPPMAMAGPGMPGQPGFPGQPGGFDPNPYGTPPGATTYPGGMVAGAPGQPGMPQQQYPGQQTYPGQPGMVDPNNPYGAAATNPYGMAQSGQAQPGMNPYDPNNPYGVVAADPYGQQANPYGSPAPYEQQQNPYGQPGSTPYGTVHQQGGSPAYPPPQAYDPSNPYATGGMHQGYGQPPRGYGQGQAGYGTANPYGGTAAPVPQQGYDPNNPYGGAQGYNQAQPGFGQPQPGYGATAPYGVQQPQQAYGTYGAPRQQPYGGQGIYSRSVEAGAVAVDVAMVKQRHTDTGKEVVLMSDGEVMKDGGATKESGDRFKIVVRTNCDCYLYILSIDGSGWAEPVFPAQDSTIPNPVKKDQEYAFPEAGHWYTLDQVKGIETFYVVASANRRTDLEESFAQLAKEKRPETTIVAKVEEPPIIPRGVGAVTTRGIVKVQDETGTALTVTPLSYAASQPGQDVTVTRWFKHE